MVAFLAAPLISTMIPAAAGAAAAVGAGTAAAAGGGFLAALGKGSKIAQAFAPLMSGKKKKKNGTKRGGGRFGGHGFGG